MYIDPRSASAIVTTLREQETYADLGLVQFICSTPDMPTLYAKNADLAALSRMLEVRGADLWLPLPTDEDEAEAYYRGIKTAMLLSDWTDGLPEEKICDGTASNRGTCTGWSRASTGCCTQQASGPDVCPEVLPADSGMRDLHEERDTARPAPAHPAPGIGRVRARRLFNNGITSPEDILKHKKEELTMILGQGIADQVLEQLQPKKRDTDEKTSIDGEMPLPASPPCCVSGEL